MKIGTFAFGASLLVVAFNACSSDSKSDEDGAGGSSAKAGAGTATGGAGKGGSQAAEAGAGGEEPTETGGAPGSAGSGGQEASLQSPACEPSDATDPQLYDVDSEPFGQSMAAWAGDWWAWSMMIPKSTNPVHGGDCSQDQTGDVWFLAGSNGTVEERSCTVPEGKALFFPLINAACNPCIETEGCETPSDEEALAACAQGPFAEETPELYVQVDGEVLCGVQAMEITSEQFSWAGISDPDEQPFSCSGPIPENSCGLTPGDNFGVSYGWYVMVKPLPVGEHVLRFRGALSFFEVDITYTLTIE